MAEDFDIEALLEAPYNNVSKMFNFNETSCKSNMVNEVLCKYCECERHAGESKKVSRDSLA